MKTITLLALTHKAKNRLAEVLALAPDWTGDWQLVDLRNAVLFSPEAGPWLLARPALPDSETSGRLSRWVHGTHDRDFRLRATCVGESS